MPNAPVAAAAASAFESFGAVRSGSFPVTIPATVRAPPIPREPSISWCSSGPVTSCQCAQRRS